MKTSWNAINWLWNYPIFIWSANSVISKATADQATTFAINDTKPYVPVVTLSTQDNAKPLQQLKSGLRCTINWNKYQRKTATQDCSNQYLDYLTDPGFPGVNKLIIE